MWYCLLTGASIEELLSYRDFHEQSPTRFTKNGLKNGKCGSFMDENVLLISEEIGQTGLEL